MSESIYDGRIVMSDVMVEAEYHKVYHVDKDGSK